MIILRKFSYFIISPKNVKHSFLNILLFTRVDLQTLSTKFERGYDKKQNMTCSERSAFLTRWSIRIFMTATGFLQAPNNSHLNTFDIEQLLR